LFKDLAANCAARRTGIFQIVPVITDDRALFKERMEVISSIDQFAFYKAWKRMIHEPSNLHLELHGNWIIDAAFLRWPWKERQAFVRGRRSDKTFGMRLVVDTSK